MSVTSGESFASNGIPGLTFLRTTETTSAADSVLQAKTKPRFATFGQEILISIAATAG